MDFKALSTPVVMSDGDNNSSKPSFFKKIREPFTKFSPKGKKPAIAILTVLMVFALALGVYLAQRPTQLAPQAASDGVEITLKPASITAGLNQEFTVDVFVDTGTSNMDIAAIQAKINYDPAQLELKSNTIKDFLPVALGTPQNTSGSTKFAVGANPNEPKRGSGTIATLTFKALSSTSTTQITFDTAQTAIVALDESGSNVAKALSPATVTFSTTNTSTPPPPASTTPETSFTLEAPTSITPGQQFSVKVNSRTDIDAANLWNAKITFPKDLIEIVSLSKTGSFVDSWTEEFISNSLGEISLTGGKPNPGLKTNSTQALMATIVFRAKTTTGTANINLLNTSSIFKNSDNTKMTPVLRSATVTIATASPSPTVSSSPVSTPTPTPTPSPSPSLSPSPSPSLSPSPSPSASAQAKGDGNNDGKVDLQDLSIMFSKWSTAVDIISHFQLDFNNDKRINSVDYASMKNLLIQLGVIRVN